jgi:hypothetical protein
MDYFDQSRMRARDPVGLTPTFESVVGHAEALCAFDHSVL